MKADILGVLGERALEQPARVNAALAANDRLKYYFSVLQMARVRADRPDRPVASLRRDRQACGVDLPEFDDAPAASLKIDGKYRIPTAARMMGVIADDLRIMAEPVEPALRDRATKLIEALPSAADDMLEGTAIDAIVHGDRQAGDSLHLAVMDLHKALNAMQVELAEERIDGASVYHIDQSDRAMIRAFMAGVNRTAPLKFGHPGLATTATRSGNRLVIQNDIGTTDAHVLVVHVEGRTAAVTYSDVHEERLAFFQSLFADRHTEWSASEARNAVALAAGQPFYLSIGSYAAPDDAALARWLEFLGSRLVYLIDWNRARKQLRDFLKGPDRIKLLRWAADNDVGHRAFLAMGGARLVYGAIEASAGGIIHFGDRLADVLGDDVAFAFMQFCFSTTTEGLLNHQSESLVRDRIRTELTAHINTGERRLLAIASDHAGLIFEIATAIRDGLLTGKISKHEAEQITRRAKRWEHEADQCLNEARVLVRRRPDNEPVGRIIETADDTADHLEEVAFLLTLLADEKGPHLDFADLLSFAEILVRASQEWVKVLSLAANVDPHGAREDAEDLLTALDQISQLEHDADEAERRVAVVALRDARDFRQLHLITAIADGLEEGADALKHASLLLRDHALGDASLH